MGMASNDKRGPKIGDSASLWNFTLVPGWTREEVAILKLALVKFGIGSWKRICDSGCLPGKLIQQLNGQTQRLLGQQSLAAFTGLHVDVDKARADNELRTGPEIVRKSGLIINTQGTLAKEDLLRLREENQQKYGVSQEEIDSIQLESLGAREASTAMGQCPDRSAPRGGADAPTNRPPEVAQISKGARERAAASVVSALLAVPNLAQVGLDSLARPEKMALLLHLRRQLAELHAHLDSHPDTQLADSPKNENLPPKANARANKKRRAAVLEAHTPWLASKPRTKSAR